MAVKLTCDVCHKEFTEFGKVDALTDKYKVPGRIEHLCTGCQRKLSQKLEALAKHYAEEMGKEVRMWLLDLENKSRPHILTS